MNHTTLSTFSADQFHAFTSGVAFIVVGLMLFMAYRLYAHNRRSSYRKLILSIGTGLLHELVQVDLSLHLIPHKAALVFADNVLYAVSFILLNFSVFELYHRQRPRTKAWLYALLGACLAIAAFTVFAGRQPLGELWTSDELHSPALDGFILALSPLFAVMFAPHIRQPRRYLIALAISFVSGLLTIASRYWFPHAAFYDPNLSILPVFYYILLFMLLFERVVELLRSAYHSSITDGLTQLYNRRFFMSQLERSLKSDKAVGAVFCDIDNFKRLNDTQGHQQADVVLRQVAAILTEETDELGLAGRYGGEELVAFVLGAGNAGKVAESIRKRIERETIVTVSIGCCEAARGIGAETLMKQADEAMYHSKKTGKNRVTDYYALQPLAGDDQAAATIER